MSDLSILHRMLPALIAYVFYELCTLVNQQTAIWIAHDAIMKQAYPSLHTHDLIRPLRPVAAGVLNAPEFHFLPYPGRAYKVISFFQAAMIIILFLGFVLFQLYAFNRLRVIFGFQDLLVYVSLGIAVLFSVIAFILAVSQPQP